MHKMNNSDLINLRNEIDRYGFSHYLAKSMNMKYPPKSFANWQHGWFWADFEYKQLDILMGYPLKNNYNIPTIVADENIKNALLDRGFQNVISGGIPFSYIANTNLKKIKDSLIIIMPHALEYTKFSKKDKLNELIESINELSKKYDKVDCLIYYDDFKNKIYDKYLQNSNINIICGARANSKHALVNIRTLFDKYEFVASHCMGSALLYAMFCDCKVSIIEPFFNYSYEYWESDPYVKENNLVEIMHYHHSKEYIKKNYNFLFQVNPKIAKKNYKIAKDLIGESNKLKHKDIKNILGWTNYSKIKLSLRYIHRKLISI